VEVADRQQIGLAGGKPFPRGRALTLGAMAVPALSAALLPNGFHRIRRHANYFKNL